MTRQTGTSLVSLEDAILQAVAKQDVAPNPDQGTHVRIVELLVSTGTVAGTQWRAIVEPTSGS